MNGLTIYSDEELKMIQKIELEILKEVIRVCSILKLNYFIIGGTALGAVRHNGFIPWDDDIDIGMLRSDYNKFIEFSEKYLNNRYYLQTPSPPCRERNYFNDKCPYTYTKVRVNGTKFVEYCNRKLNMHQGIYIDIFPFDEVPDDENLNKRQFKKVRKLKFLYVLRESPDVSAQPNSIIAKIKSKLRFFLHYIIKLIPRKFLLEQINKECTLYNGTGQSAYACLDFPKRKCEYILKSELFPLQKHSFEGLYTNIPNDFEKYLFYHYGDWKELPPANQRYGHKPWLIDIGEVKIGEVKI